MSDLRIGKYYGNDLDGKVYQIKEILDSDYADITSVSMWFLMSKETNNDYLLCRDLAINYIISVGGFNNLSNTDKQVAIINFCVRKEDRDTLYTNEEQEVFWETFCKLSEECRHNRWEKAKAFASYRLSVLDSNDLGVSTMGLNEKYVKYSISTFDEDGIDGLVDWVMGTNGFVNNGLPEKTYFTHELANGIIKIIKPSENEIKN